jgi:hypothetical protein
MFAMTMCGIGKQQFLTTCKSFPIILLRPASARVREREKRRLPGIGVDNFIPEAAESVPSV